MKLWKKKVEYVDFNLLSKAALNEIIKLKKSKLKKSSLQDINKVLRIYLHKKYGLSKGLTIEEFGKEIKNKKIPKKIKLLITLIILEIYRLEYKSDKKLSRKEYNLLLSEIRKLIHLVEESN